MTVVRLDIYFICCVSSDMKMEELQNAQLVGQEFVKQYYAVLKQAPEFLHRY